MKKKVIRLNESDIENLVKKIIKEENNVNVEGRNFIVKRDGREHAYITGDIDEVEVMQLHRGGYTFSLIITLVDFHSKNSVGSFLRYSYNSEQKQSRLSYKYNYTKWENFFSVVDPHFHTLGNWIVDSLEKMAIEKINEKMEKDNPTEEPKKGVFKRMFGESRIDELGGYDSPELGAAHGKSTMEAILEIFTHISDDFSKLNNMGNDILDDKLARETRILLKNVQPILERYGKSWTDAEKRRLSK